MQEAEISEAVMRLMANAVKMVKSFIVSMDIESPWTFFSRNARRA